MPDPETIFLRVTVVGGRSYADDFTVIWRGLPIGRIMRAPGLPPLRIDGRTNWVSFAINCNLIALATVCS